MNGSGRDMHQASSDDTSSEAGHENEIFGLSMALMCAVGLGCASVSCGSPVPSPPALPALMRGGGPILLRRHGSHGVHILYADNCFGRVYFVTLRHASRVLPEISFVCLCPVSPSSL